MQFSFKEFLTLVLLLRLNSVVYLRQVKVLLELALVVVYYKIAYLKRLLNYYKVFKQSRT